MRETMIKMVILTLTAGALLVIVCTVPGAPSHNPVPAGQAATTVAQQETERWLVYCNLKRNIHALDISEEDAQAYIDCRQAGFTEAGRQQYLEIQHEALPPYKAGILDAQLLLQNWRNEVAVFQAETRATQRQQRRSLRERTRAQCFAKHYCDAAMRIVPLVGWDAADRRMCLAGALVNEDLLATLTQDRDAALACAGHTSRAGQQ